MITSYVLHGDFIESCDCFDLCPCWVDDDPDEDHCTGLVAWKLGTDSLINGSDVSGAVVAAVTGHSGGRRTSSALTVLYIDVRKCSGDHSTLLTNAFTGKNVAGSLSALATVTGTVLGPAHPADIEFPDGDGHWTLSVKPRKKDGSAGTEAAVKANGRPRTFEGNPEGPDKNCTAPLELLGTALHAELQIQHTARAQQTDSLSVRVPALPGGYVEVTTRSGMRGSFVYEHEDQHSKKKSGKGRRPGATPGESGRA